jgi:hypothetical protein
MRYLARMVALASLVGLLSLPSPSALAANPPKFKVLCKHSHFAREDPIVAPGEMSAHMHDFLGNTTTNKDSTYASMRAGDSTCSAVGDTAGYWVPTVLDGNGGVISPQAMTVYYRGGPNGEHVTPTPADLRMVSPVFVYGSTDTINVKFPPCWDGVLTHVNDTSHMAWPRNKIGASSGDCPSTNPIRLPAVSLNIRYRVPVQGKDLSSGDASTMHGDFWNTWDQDILERHVNRCLNQGAGVDCGTIKDK